MYCVHCTLYIVHTRPLYKKEMLNAKVSIVVVNDATSIKASNISRFDMLIWDEINFRDGTVRLSRGCNSYRLYAMLFSVPVSASFSPFYSLHVNVFFLAHFCSVVILSIERRKKKK